MHVIKFIFLFTIFLLSACGKTPPQDPPNLAGAKDSLSRGHHWYERGCYNEAERYYHEALAFARLSDHVPLLISAQNSLGAVNLAQKRIDAAASYLEDAFQSSAGVPGQPDMDKTLANLGSLAYETKKYKDAEELWLKAAELAIKNKRSPALYYCNLGRLYLDLGRQPEFEDMTRKALASAETANNLYAKADAYNLAGRSAMKAGNLLQAEEFFQKALALDRKTENSRGLAQDTEALGRLMMAREKWAEATGFFDRSFFLYLFIDDYESARLILKELELVSRKNKHAARLDHYRKTLQNKAPRKFIDSVCP